MKTFRLKVTTSEAPDPSHEEVKHLKTTAQDIEYELIDMALKLAKINALIRSMIDDKKKG
jgi:hypothetical protein